MVNWVKVSERLPNKNKDYLVFLKNGHVYIDRFTGLHKDGLWHFGFNVVTHWMPLPEPPKEETDCRHCVNYACNDYQEWCQSGGDLKGRSCYRDPWSTVPKPPEGE